MEQSRFNFKLTLQLLVLGVLLTAIYKYQFILDQYALMSFRPSPEVQAIAERLQLTPRATALLYRAKPQIDDKQTFNKDCETSKGQLELGCYTRNRIYVLRIENRDLAPEMDVVLAHELMHAAYDRLSQKERDKLNVELQAAYAKITDPELRARMADYAKSEPGEENNELDSILGTEYPNLSPALEAHYANYFMTRSVITEAQARYQQVFTSRRKQLDAELAVIRALKGQLTSLNHRMEALRASGSIAAYNSLVPQQNQLVDNINNKIKAYQQGVDEYNALSKVLDSQEITTPAESTVQ